MVYCECFLDELTWGKMQKSQFTKFTELFSELENCSEIEQKQKIEEMNKRMNKMNKEELCSVFTNGQLDRLNKMIEERKISLESAIPLLKHMGYCKAMKDFLGTSLCKSYLQERFEKMIVEEKKKKNEKLLFDLCECYISLYESLREALFSICVPCLLKVALNKEESEENQKEVEMALLALSNIRSYHRVGNGLYLNGMTEILKYHQKNHNLTQLAYQSAWVFLISRWTYNKCPNSNVLNELHFVGEATRELELLSKCVYLKKKEEERGKETKVEILLLRWLVIIVFYSQNAQIHGEEFVKLTRCIIDLCRAAKGNNREIQYKCFSFLYNIILREAESDGCVLREEAVDFILEEMHGPTIDNEVTTLSAYKKGKDE
eukprot:MONOS_14995.1-p1 / transcript=MONOS_14995.1 / gene=MONOS_14995 / organism=Monocercomonoides_exilis_PA203 / gene_product=unspecified product / transcript_product=unspecified product / location=Mono_scaffold01122:5424-6741(-) / protein_length=376 / sequence_SO=supercontig / SO=protein_coding / is_pseudo=false